MPVIIDNPSAQECSLEEAADALADLRFDPRDPDNTAQAAGWLRKLTNNRQFLADHLINQLTARASGDGAGVIDSGYGPQAIMLSPLRSGMFIRANIWPARQDLCFRTSGGESFVYGVPHDHNFSFLTSGYSGPGYISDYYEYDYDTVTGYAGEDAGLRFIERSALSEGKLMLYRAHVDVHAQMPPDALSVSLNVMHIEPAQCWFDQYAFDLEKGQVARVLSPNATEAFLRVAVASGNQDALDFAEWAGRRHPSERVRWASFDARAGQVSGQARDDLWREAEACGSLMVAKMAQAARPLETTG